MICSAFDFWFVKNISGRLLVGLRWWNEVNEDGTEEWIFESANEVRDTNIDTSIFWGSLYITPLFWGVFFFFKVISISWLDAMICFIALVLSGSNMVGYYRCSSEQGKKLDNLVKDGAAKGISTLIGLAAK